MAAVRHQIVPATIAHVYALAATMRREDAAEATELCRQPKEFLRRSFRYSLVVKTALIDGEVAAMFGMTGDLLLPHGSPWLVTTAAVERVPVAFVREGKQALAEMRGLKPVLENFVAASYTRAVRFVAVLGFEIDAPQPLGPKGALFHRFHLGGD